MRIIGVDPGLTGAIAILDGNKVINLFEMPVMAEGKKNKRQLNSAQLVSIIKENIKKTTVLVISSAIKKSNPCCWWVCWGRSTWKRNNIR